MNLIEFVSWFQISVSRKYAEFVQWVVDYAGGKRALHTFSDYMKLPFLWKSAT